ncbi:MULTISPECIES: HsdM family class I SAM-dependent methyltransferase [Arthrospira]|uniref:HsdM family class I SAM-dependent methyltransferase n=1 Tax=Oscillatoriales TaxID=1150 RepID=UPI0001C38A62|nr:N-6 DNA methylase [Arthrospira platensis]AMW29677.1 restriction endonuclease subunit M [Arthrospira platensis YZ]KDR55773.1 restriction endonuclease subunit M [Arthrospira platensis str. Paraca]MBD2668136.1 N-6 DNA methylase [Arthrospira platensis FACHB-439]MBD2708695.1 N-6 DNA methylase [Arthrospira platensis FACHB-835]MDF2212348.1 N-6 DNA methylase [Arthrospira platensis NCB002]MDT9181551.1 N-6 DNA methylase [Limnospira sp. PMC 289.06]MDT9297766.1 N-6 DNA methylase [Arthrospira platensi
MSVSGLLELAHQKLHWPELAQVMEPTGAGPSVYARLAREKLGRNIKNLLNGSGADLQVGVLAPNPQGDETEAPIAVVCQFPIPVSEAILKETYRLAWSFARSPSLITAEPDRLRIWSCYEGPPTEFENLRPVAEVSRQQLELFDQPSLSQQAADTFRIHWADLVSGQFFQANNKRFQRSQSADQMLLSNLKSVRKQLNKLKLDYDTIHDLLARIIFIQFLFDRKDSQGNAAFNPDLLTHLYEQAYLLESHANLTEILRNKTDTYNFFRWLNNKFNGDLFPGKGATEGEREHEWQVEEHKVTEQHLNLLAEFVSGDLEMETGQGCLWPQYSFDAIPLEFISSIYEEFVDKGKKNADKGVHYTPGHLVDFILDGVLPWDSDEWDLKILDPACGSGIFLVKAFQRLIYRWKKAYPVEEITAPILQQILAGNLFGVDVNPQAVRVASFSLYLTMCDEIDPRYYWEQVRFPRLRDKRLISADFFQENVEGFRTVHDAGQYDLVIGNAPWGRNTVTRFANSWARDNEWPITYGNIGPLFLPKSAALAKAGQPIAMMQPAGGLIFNQISTAQEFRHKLFCEYKVDEIVNLSALRFGLFKDAISPTCIVTMSAELPNGEPLSYICPKPVASNEDDYRIVIEPYDINLIYPQEAIQDSLVWTVLMWGGRRDLALVRRLSQGQNFEKLERAKIAIKRQGIIRGDRKKYQEDILGKRLLRQFPKGPFIFINPEDLPINADPDTHSRDSSDLSAFEIPQLILKQAWTIDSKRFQAAIIRSDEDKQGVLCSESYVTIHVAPQYTSTLEAACLTYNSKLAVYYLLLSSGRFASYRPEPNINELLRVPIPESPMRLHNIQRLDFDDVDHRVREAFSLKDSEWLLIEDIFNYTLPDFKGNRSSPGRQSTRSQSSDLKTGASEDVLNEYCNYFLKVIKAGFGTNKNICVKIFQEQNHTSIPVRLIAFYLTPNDEGEEIEVEPLDSLELIEQLERLNQSFLEKSSIEEGGIFYQRVAKIYDSIHLDGKTIPTVYFVKPDKRRYWTRSMALRDADEVAAALMMWHSGFESYS